MTTRTSDTAARLARAIGSPPGLLPAEFRAYLTACVSIVETALDLGADIEQACQFIDHVPVPPNASGPRPRNIAGRLGLRDSYGRGPRPGPNASRGLWVVHHQPATRNNGRGRPPVTKPTGARPVDLVAAFRQALVDALGPLPTSRR